MMLEPPNSRRHNEQPRNDYRSGATYYVQERYTLTDQPDPQQDIGYIRVSTHDQNTARQLDGVHLDKVFEEHASGKNSDRPALQTCLDYVRDGDVLHVHSIDRLARNLQDLLSIVTTLKEKGVGNSVAGKSDAFQELQLHIIAAVAQFERTLIL